MMFTTVLPIWLFICLLIVAYLTMTYKLNLWVVRYVIMIFFPISMGGFLIAVLIIRYLGKIVGRNETYLQVLKNVLAMMFKEQL